MKKLPISLAALAALALASTASAFPIVVDNGTLSASADFTYDVGTQKLTIVLTNTTPGVTDAGQMLTGLKFSGIDGFTTASISSGTGKLTSISSDLGTVPANGDVKWVIQSEGAFGTLLNFHGVIAGGPPDGAIIGPETSMVGSQPKWQGINPSVDGNGPHNPVVYKTATFVIDAPGFTFAPNFGATFYFGTDFQTDIPGGGVPEPASLGMLTLGALGLLARRRKA